MTAPQDAAAAGEPLPDATARGAPSAGAASRAAASPDGPGADAASAHVAAAWPGFAQARVAAAPGLGAGIAAACVGALGCAVLAWSLAGVVPPRALTRVLAGAVLLGYGAWLYARAGRSGTAPGGALVWALGGLGTAVAAWTLAPGAGAAAGALLVWLAALRGWLYAPTGAQLLTGTGWLAGGAVLALGTAVHTGSAALAAWVFLLTQAPFGITARRTDPHDAFASARRAARDALRRAGLEG